MTRALSHDDIAGIRAALLEFFDAAARPLPWRASRDPYAIWVSEVMAQQTRVETVVPYYDRWIRTFPDVHSLADAPVDAVLKAWEGLGYYARARNLHAAARAVRERHDGALPRTYDELRALPGIGDYTAGAILSIAFGARRAAVDGNVRRVLARLLDHPDPPPALLRRCALALVPTDRPGDFNQALMELGATVCGPRTPSCERCPIAGMCAARAAGTQTVRPRTKRRKAVPTIDIATAIVQRADGRVLVTQRPLTGLLAGMWCFPGEEVAAGSDAAARVAGIAQKYTATHGTPLRIGTVEQVFTHRRERYHCHVIEAEAASGRAAAGTAWLGEEDDSLALPRAQQRIRALAFARARPGVTLKA
jgi:A/G-specific adenine glycosylase